MLHYLHFTTCAVKLSYLITPEERPKAYFRSHLETNISASEAHLLILFPWSVSRSLLKFGENVA